MTWHEGEILSKFMHNGPIRGDFGVEMQGEITIIELNESLRITRARYE